MFPNWLQQTVSNCRMITRGRTEATDANERRDVRHSRAMDVGHEESMFSGALAPQTIKCNGTIHRCIDAHLRGANDLLIVFRVFLGPSGRLVLLLVDRIPRMCEH